MATVCNVFTVLCKYEVINPHDILVLPSLFYSWKNETYLLAV